VRPYSARYEPLALPEGDFAHGTLGKEARDPWRNHGSRRRASRLVWRRAVDPSVWLATNIHRAPVARSAKSAAFDLFTVHVQNPFIVTRPRVGASDE